MQYIRMDRLGTEPGSARLGQLYVAPNKTASARLFQYINQGRWTAVKRDLASVQKVCGLVIPGLAAVVCVIKTTHTFLHQRQPNPERPY
jgi:hypothetical protein